MAGASGIGQLNWPAILFGIAGLFGLVNFSECWSVVAQADGVHQGVLHFDGRHTGPILRRCVQIADDVHAGGVQVLAEIGRGRPDAVRRELQTGQGCFHRPTP